MPTNTPMTPREALLLAIGRVGNQMKFTKAVGLESQGTLQYWVRKGKVPAKHVLTIERLTGISRHDLCPSIYPRDLDLNPDLTTAPYAPAKLAD